MGSLGDNWRRHGPNRSGLRRGGRSLSDVDLCLACDYGQPSELENPRMGFCQECQSSGRAEIYLSFLALQDGDLEEAREWFDKALKKFREDANE